MFDRRRLAREHVMRLATAWLRDPAKPGSAVQPVLDYFEDLGSMLRYHLSPIELIWNSKEQETLSYWVALRGVIDGMRQKEHDKTIYSEFEYVAKRIARYEGRRTRSRVTYPTAEEAHSFLRSELGIEIRPAIPSDHERVIAIDPYLFAMDPHPERLLKELYRDFPDDFLVAEVLDEPVACCIGQVNSQNAEIRSLAVDPRFRRLGIGRRIATNWLTSAKAKGATSCSLLLQTESDAALRFCEALGFRFSPRRRPWWRKSVRETLTKQL